MRTIIDDCKTRPVNSKYKIFVLDECFVPETEILTDKGYKQFKDLDHTEKIAQYNDDGSIEFVTPVRYINQEYNLHQFLYTNNIYLYDYNKIKNLPNFHNKLNANQ